jgi:hypothetical protein
MSNRKRSWGGVLQGCVGGDQVDSLTRPLPASVCAPEQTSAGEQILEIGAALLIDGLHPFVDSKAEEVVGVVAKAPIADPLVSFGWGFNGEIEDRFGHAASPVGAQPAVQESAGSQNDCVCLEGPRPGAGRCHNPEHPVASGSAVDSPDNGWAFDESASALKGLSSKGSLKAQPGDRWGERWNLKNAHTEGAFEGGVRLRRPVEAEHGGDAEETSLSEARPPQ